MLCFAVVDLGNFYQQLASEQYRGDGGSAEEAETFHAIADGGASNVTFRFSISNPAFPKKTAFFTLLYL